jgi:hypothetical protein
MNGAEKIKERICQMPEACMIRSLDDAKHKQKALLLRLRRRLFRSVALITEKAKEEAALIKQRYQGCRKYGR